MVDLAKKSYRTWPKAGVPKAPNTKSFCHIKGLIGLHSWLRRKITASAESRKSVGKWNKILDPGMQTWKLKPVVEALAGYQEEGLWSRLKVARKNKK